MGFGSRGPELLYAVLGGPSSAATALSMRFLMGGSLSSPCEDVFVQVVRDQGFQVEAWPRLGRLRGAWVALGRAHTRGAAPKARQRQQSARETASGAGGRSGLRTLRSWPHGPQRQAEARHSRKTQVQALHVELERFHEIPLLLHVLTLPVGWCCFAALRLDFLDGNEMQVLA